MKKQMAPTKVPPLAQTMLSIAPVAGTTKAPRAENAKAIEPSMFKIVPCQVRAKGSHSSWLFNISTAVVVIAAAPANPRRPIVRGVADDR